MARDYIKTYIDLCKRLEHVYGTDDIPRETIENMLMEELVIIRPETVRSHMILLENFGYLKASNAMRTFYKINKQKIKEEIARMKKYEKELET
jgi:hypothetical protein